MSNPLIDRELMQRSVHFSIYSRENNSHHITSLMSRISNDLALSEPLTNRVQQPFQADGYSRLLIDPLKSHFDQIKEVKDLIAKELLIHLYLLLKDGPKQAPLILEFALKHYELLGYIISLTTLCQNSLINSIQKGSSDEIIELFDDEVAKLHQQIALKISDPYADHSLIIGVELAKFLIDRSGHLNFGIIENLKKSLFFPNAESYFLILDFYKSDPELKRALLNTQCPERGSIGAYLVSLTLQTPDCDNIESYHVKQAILSLLISSLRQNEERTCFATSIAVGLKTGNPIRTIVDLNSLLKEGHLVRTIDKKQHRFPFLLHCDSPLFDSSLNLEKESAVKTLLQLPRMSQVLCLMGIKEKEKFLEELLESSFKSGKTIQFKIGRFLDYLGQSIHQTGSKSKSLEAIQKEIRFGVGSNHHPLGTAWVHALSGMCDWDQSLGRTLTSATLKTIENQLKTNSMVEAAAKSALLKMVEIQSKERITYYYDATLRKMSSHSVTYGGFILYCFINKEEEKMARIDSQQSFEKALYALLDQVNVNLDSSSIPKLLTDEVSSLIVKLKAVIIQPKFIQELLTHYHPSNAGRAHLPAQLLTHTPWCHQSGLDTKIVLETYLEAKDRIQSVKILATNAEELIRGLSRFLKFLPSEEKQYYQSNCHASIIMRIKGYHAFSLLVGHKAFLALWNNQALSGYLESYKDKGKALSHTVLSKQVCEKILAKLKVTVISQGVEPQTLKEFYTNLLDDSRHTTKKVIEELPQEILVKFKELVIPFADTNWSSSHQEIHWCFLYNPFSQKIEIWQTNNTLDKFSPVSISLKEAQWELFRLE